MPRHYRFDPTIRRTMAKAYILGEERPADIARQYGCSPSYVINAAKAWETEQHIKALDRQAKHQEQELHNLKQQIRKRTIVDPPPIEMPEPAHLYRLAPVSIQHGERKP